MHKLHDYFGDKDHIIWDWNGTLLADLDLAVATVNRLLEDANLPTLSLAEYREHFGFPVIDYYRRLGLPTDPVSFSEMAVRFNRLFHAGVSACDLWPSARATLAFVKASGKLQSILSASEQNVLREQVHHFNVGHLFDHVAGIADQLAASKIQRGHELMKTAGIAPEKTILIGDTDHDAEVAKALGIEAILVDHGHQNFERLAAAHPKVLKVL